MSLRDEVFGHNEEIEKKYIESGKYKDLDIEGLSEELREDLPYYKEFVNKETERKNKIKKDYVVVTSLQDVLFKDIRKQIKKYNFLVKLSYELEAMYKKKDKREYLNKDIPEYIYAINSYDLSKYKDKIKRLEKELEDK